MTEFTGAEVPIDVRRLTLADWSAHRGVLAWSPDGPVGLAWGLSDPDDPARAYLVSMWVAPAHRGGDLAPRLLAAVEDWAIARGARAILAGVTAGNARALAFYRRCGYADREPARPGPGRTSFAEAAGHRQQRGGGPPGPPPRSAKRSDARYFLTTVASSTITS